MKVTVGSSEYTVKFAYEGTRGNKTTICWVSGPDRNSMGMAKVHPNDIGKFNKAVGRKLALSKALGTHPGRLIPEERRPYKAEVRTAIWKSYFQYCKSEGVTPA